MNNLLILGILSLNSVSLPKVNQLCRVDKQRASIVYIGKCWANDKAVYPHYLSWRFKTAEAVLLQVPRKLQATTMLQALES